jgi:hypothetical protein
MNRSRPVLSPVAALLALACLGSAPAEPSDGRKVLFVGNSLTYVNDLPAIVSALADSAGQPLDVSSVAYPDFSLEDHWTLGTAPKTIRAGGWGVVILQQGPSSLPASRDNLRTWTKRFADLITAQGGRPALYQVWPTIDRRGDFDRASESYALAAQDVNGILIPGGEAWRAAWRQRPALELYSPDGLHPSVTGSYLVAMVAVMKLTGADPAKFPAAVQLRSGVRVGVDPTVIETLRAAATAVK